tara:strand:+ start:266 stop:2002 length:1737 start_codon:yes stop_codon:yes gene_type:complete
MSNLIKIINPELVEKIAAGEVIERPSSIIKELVENSIDANSKLIEINIDNGGIDLITVKDNGDGIKNNQIQLAFQRHATSKISTLDDLDKISTLGFRGEALPSIASVSHVHIKTSDNNDANEFTIQAGKEGEIKPCSRGKGTTISIRKLFENFPARKKFLKSPESEQIAITKILKQYFLSYPEISFKYSNSKKTIFNLHASSLENRISDIFGGTYLKELISVNNSKGPYSISGYLGNINLARKRIGEQYLFVNGRFILNRMINHSIYRSYSSLLDRGEYPFFVLNLSIDPSLFDINVHPSKREIRFENEWKANQFIKESIIKSLKNITRIAPTFNFNIPDKQINISRELELDYDKISYQNIDDIVTSKESNSLNNKIDEILSDGAKEVDLNIDDVWQIHNKYLVTRLNDGMVIIDQHVAHERILYDSAIDGLNNKYAESQTVLFPKTLDFKGDEYDILIKLLPYLDKIGFKIREFGENKIIIEGIPVYMKNNDEIALIKDIIDKYDTYGDNESELYDKLAANYSCKAAVKAGDKLEDNEIKHLINKLFQSPNPYFCPHGRPIIVNLTIEELDKRFERL